MKDIDRNTRTFIICFVIGIFALVPLRFYEVGNQQMEARNSHVLGLTDESEGIQTPDSQLYESSRPVLEYPYEELERESAMPDCLNQQEVDSQIKSLVDILGTDGLDEETVSAIIEEIDRLENSVCR